MFKTYRERPSWQNITNDKKQIWKDYIRHLFAAERGDVREENKHTDQLCIVKSKVKYKSDNIQIDLLKPLNDGNLTHLAELFNKNYGGGEITKDVLKSVFIPLPQNNFCLLLKVIQQRIYRKCQEQLVEA